MANSITPRSARIWKFTIGSAEEIHLLPDSSTDFMTDRGPQWAVECGAAHGALAMTTPGDTTMATLAEVEKAMKGMSVRVAR